MNSQIIKVLDYNNMIIPVRCFTCGKVVGNKLEIYQSMLKDGCDEQTILDSIKINRYCCRRMLLTNMELIDKLLNYSEYEFKK